MGFDGFLRGLSEAKFRSSSRQLFYFLGGERTLGHSYRSFLNVHSGKFKPSAKLFTAVFSRVDPIDQKDCVLSYLESTIQDVKVSEAKPILEYLRGSLTPATPRNVKSIYDTRKKSIYTDAQLKFLSDNSEALRLHKKILLEERIERSKLTQYSDNTVLKLIEHELVVECDDMIAVPIGLYQLPSVEKSAKSTLRKRTEYLLRQLDEFVSREDYSKQTIKFTTQLSLIHI